jgi:hypothetical protein
MVRTIVTPAMSQVSVYSSRGSQTVTWKPKPHGDLAQVLRQLAGADHQHPVARAVDRQRGLAVERQAVGGLGWPERCAPSLPCRACGR